MWKGIIISGTSGAGKKNLQQKLCENIYFQKVKSVTTMLKRANEDIEEYNQSYLNVDKDYFELNKDKFLLVTEYKNQKYGILKSDIKKILNEGKFPVIVIYPNSIETILRLLENEYLSFFIDSNNEILNSRILKRDNTFDIEKEIKNRSKDRLFKMKCIYRVSNNSDIEIALNIILEVWRLGEKTGIITQKSISTFIQGNVLLENADSENVKSASYDLRLGDQYYYDGRINELTNREPFLMIEPYDYAIVSCKEISSLPNDIVARFDLSVNLFKQGVILSNGPQMDPGFRGTLFCLLFNTSDKSVYLKREEHYATIEFTRLIEPTSPYEGKYQDVEYIEKYISSNVLRGGIHELKKEIQELKKDNKASQNMFIGLVTLMLAIISTILILK